MTSDTKTETPMPEAQAKPETPKAVPQKPVVQKTARRKAQGKQGVSGNSYRFGKNTLVETR